MSLGLQMIKVVNKNNNLIVNIPLDVYEEPWWVKTIYVGKYIIVDNILELQCRNTTVTITKPVLVKTPMGTMQQMQSFSEQWVYFDMPGKSILVEDGDDITNEVVDIKLVEKPLLEESNNDMKLDMDVH